MRHPTIAVLALSCALAACSSGEDEAATGEGLGAEEIAERAEAAPEMQPGQYRTEVSLLEFDMPGLPESQTDSMRQMFAGELAKANTFCLTEEEAAQGPDRMLRHLSESDCTVSRFDVSAGGVSGEMQCAGEGGLEGTVAIDGTMSGDSSSIVMESTQRLPGVPGDGVHMKMRMDSQRIGECTG